jgi:hypothetical protein
MTVLFLAFFDAVLAERLSPRLAGAILFPLLAFGGASLAWWRARGDLSLYALAQYYPALALPLLLWLRPGRGDAALWSAAGAYALSKACEALDRAIFSLGGVVGGHALKHLFAALAAACLLRAARSGR